MYSVMFDGATDCSISPIVYCRYLKNSHTTYVILGLEDLEHTYTDGVFEALSRSMER